MSGRVEDVPRETSVWEALGRVTWRYVSRGLVFWLLVGVVAGIGVVTGSRIAWELAVVFGIAVSFGAALVFPASVWQDYVEAKRAKRRRELIRAAARSGVVPSRATQEERFKQLLSDSSGTLLAAVLLEALLIAPFALNTGMFFHGSSIDWFFVGFAGFVVLPLPLYIVFSMVADLNDIESSSVATARAERAYREAVEDKKGLEGSLVLDEHARQVGGELTMRQEAGGLAMHEEVALDLDAMEESADRAALAEEVAPDVAT